MGGRASDFAGFAGFDQFIEVDEERVRVVGARRCFRVILDREDRKAGVTKPFDSAVVEVDLRDLGAAALDRFRIGGEPVILGRDGDLAGLEIFHRLIPSAVAELQFEGRAAEGVGDHLMPEADSEHRKIGQKGGDGLMNIRQGGRISGTVGKEDGVGLQGARLLGGGGAGRT